MHNVIFALQNCLVKLFYHTVYDFYYFLLKFVYFFPAFFERQVQFDGNILKRRKIISKTTVIVCLFTSSKYNSNPATESEI